VQGKHHAISRKFCISEGDYYQLWLETEESDAEETDILQQVAAGVPFNLLTCSGPLALVINQLALVLSASKHEQHSSS
jgi:hypothetical protein